MPSIFVNSIYFGTFIAVDHIHNQSSIKCFRNGIIVCLQQQFHSSHEEYKDFCLVDEPGLKILDSRRLPVNLISGLFPKNPEQFYFVARQSKSRRIFLFGAKALADSNANLVSKFRLIVES
jgi:hypothetical protein